MESMRRCISSSATPQLACTYNLYRSRPDRLIQKLLKQLPRSSAIDTL